MSKKGQIYKCNICGNIVELIHVGGGKLVCCGEPMEKLSEKTKDEGAEKHVPVIEKTSDGIKVKIGSAPHPMEKEHYIKWIEIEANGKAYREYLTPESLPEAEFCVNANNIRVREYCNVHGLWSA